MTYSIKLLIPVGLAALAGVLNWFTLSSKTVPVAFVTVSRDLEVGERFDPSALKAVELPAGFSKLDETAILWKYKEQLSGQPVQRNLSQGDIVFYRDTNLRGQQWDLRPGEDAYPISLTGLQVAPNLLRVGNSVTLRLPSEGNSEPAWVGPFRIVSVGSKITNDIGSDSRSNSATDICVAYRKGVSRRHDMNLERLEQFCDRQRLGDTQLLGIRLHRLAD